MEDFFIFAMVGFFAQLIDGALGMGYGVISSVVLLATGVPPAHTSASVHAAKLFTTATSGTSHILHGNVERRALVILSIAGIAGGIAGALVLVNLHGATIRPFVFGYLLIMGLVIIWRGLLLPATRTVPGRFIAPLGVAGGFLDAIGGGGWGPVVTSSLIGAGAPPRYVVGTVNAAEFVVTCAIVSAFAVTLLFGSWTDSHGLADHGIAVAGLIAGGIPAAFFAGWLLKNAPRKPLMIAVGLLIVGLSAYELSKVLIRT
ncbi:MAG: sulfite exporter TauE/SafE family protein [Alphaproteobacteria bacterium]|nr:sulfite exporter TauE/SafE family protein [Alphaproteobacteria bacterium]